MFSVICNALVIWFPKEKRSHLSDTKKRDPARKPPEKLKLPKMAGYYIGAVGPIFLISPFDTLARLIYPKAPGKTDHPNPPTHFGSSIKLIIIF